VLSTDDYLPDYELVAEDQRDEPDHLDWNLLVHHLAELRAGRAASVPVWSFQTHRREGVRVVDAGELVVLEGIHALHQRIAKALDMRIYVEAPAVVRWARWEQLERTGQRGWGVEKAKLFFDGVAEPTFGKRAAGYRATADVVVVNAGGLGL
jgi:uridine kinase